jgi:hypothetical protein
MLGEQREFSELSSYGFSTFPEEGRAQAVLENRSD